MSLVHAHLILNHIPIVGIPLALMFLGCGLFSKNIPTQRFSLLLLVGIAFFVIPIFLSGQTAEDVVEQLPGVAEVFIEAHEEGAVFSLILTLATGLLALLALIFRNSLPLSRRLNLCVLFAGFVAAASLVYTANLGGQIRHTEVRMSNLKTSVRAEK